MTFCLLSSITKPSQDWAFFSKKRKWFLRSRKSFHYDLTNGKESKNEILQLVPVSVQASVNTNILSHGQYILI